MTAPGIFTPAERRQVGQDLITLITLLPGPFQVEVRPLTPEGNQGFCLTPVSEAMGALAELAHLRLGWWEEAEGAQNAAATLQAWFDDRAQQPWSRPTAQTQHHQTLSINPLNPLAGYRRRIWTQQVAESGPVVFGAHIREEADNGRLLEAVSLRSPAAAQEVMEQVEARVETLDTLTMSDQNTFGPLLERRFEGFCGYWGQAEIRLHDAPAARTMTCDAAAYLSPCLTVGLVTAFAPIGPLVFAVFFSDIDGGTGRAGTWTQAMGADLVRFMPGELFEMNTVTFGIRGGSVGG